jgi:hypothetical protein
LDRDVRGVRRQRLQVSNVRRQNCSPRFGNRNDDGIHA